MWRKQSLRKGLCGGLRIRGEGAGAAMWESTPREHVVRVVCQLVACTEYMCVLFILLTTVAHTRHWCAPFSRQVVQAV